MMLAKGLPNMPPRTLTDKTIAALKVAKRTNIADPKLAGHYVRITPLAYLMLEKSGLSPSAIVGCVRMASRKTV